MLNVFKMDMRRMLRSKVFYICIIFMNLITGTMIFTGIIPDFAAVMGSGAEDMTSSMMGIGMVFMFIAILFAVFICGEFSSGFAKNVFTHHSNPLHYIGGKLLSLVAAGAITLIAYTIVSMILLTVQGGGVDLPGGIAGLLTFLVEKILVVGVFAGLILVASLYTRKAAVGIIAGVVASTGVLVSVLNMIASQFDLTWIPNALHYSISGLSNKASLVFSGLDFATVLIGSAIWIAVYSALGCHAIKVKDV